MTEQLNGLLRAITHEHVYIQTHNFPDPDAIASAYGLQQLLRHCGVESTVCYQGKIERFNTNYIMEKLGISFSNYINALRIEEAVKLLTTTDMPITDVCFASGFTCTRTFNRAFMGRIGVSPREYRVRQKNERLELWT